VATRLQPCAAEEHHTILGMHSKWGCIRELLRVLAVYTVLFDVHLYYSIGSELPNFETSISHVGSVDTPSSGMSSGVFASSSGQLDCVGDRRGD
jgi:hypothetical protein